MNVGPAAGPMWRLMMAGLLPLALAGCIARVTEQRGYGAAHPASAALPPVRHERRDAEAGDECRDVTVTPMVREVDVRRSFADPGPFGAQVTNVGLAGVLGAGALFVGYDLSTLACAQNNNTGCSGQTQSGASHAEAFALALAAIPMAFVIVNAARVQDRRYVEAAPPEVEETEWVPCDR